MFLPNITKFGNILHKMATMVLTIYFHLFGGITNLHTLNIFTVLLMWKLTYSDFGFFGTICLPDAPDPQGLL